MRRFFVTWLILLFPLNVFALSMSVASMQQPATSEQAAPASHSVTDSLFAGIVDAQPGGDIDSDEPPAVADLHDSVNEDDPSQLVLNPRAPAPLPVPLRRSQSSSPPLKPPPTA